MTSWIATDLDGTLLRRERTEGAMPGSWRGEAPSSWIPKPAYDLLRAMVRAALPIVPVTARDGDSFARVAIEGVPFSGAILANGALLLTPGGLVDKLHQEEMAATLPPWRDILDSHARNLAELAGAHGRARLVYVGEFAAYAVAKASVECWKKDAIREALAQWETSGCHLSVLGPEVQILPPVVSKAVGVLAFANRYHEGTPPLLGLGDMAADVPFMKIASFAATPADSPLASMWPD